MAIAAPPPSVTCRVRTIAVKVVITAQLSSHQHCSWYGGLRLSSSCLQWCSQILSAHVQCWPVLFPVFVRLTRTSAPMWWWFSSSEISLLSQGLVPAASLSGLSETKSPGSDICCWPSRLPQLLRRALSSSQVRRYYRRLGQPSWSSLDPPRPASSAPALSSPTPPSCSLAPLQRLEGLCSPQLYCAGYHSIVILRCTVSSRPAKHSLTHSLRQCSQPPLQVRLYQYYLCQHFHHGWHRPLVLYLSNHCHIPLELLRRE